MAGPHLVVMGVMGAGKTTVGRAVAGRIRRPYRDSDDDLVALTGRTGHDLADDPEVGVEELHRLEAAVLLGALAAPDPTVVTAAAWVVESAWCRLALGRRATVAWLDAPARVLWERAVNEDHRRTMDLDEFTAVADRRRGLFEAVADLRLDAQRPVDDLVLAVLAHLAIRP